jgi:spore germination cell wall hydrolase CwlJ-like protein
LPETFTSKQEVNQWQVNTQSLKSPWIRKRYVGAFSWTELDSVPRTKKIPWQQATMVAVAAYDNQEALKVPGALFYHADRISPRWSRTKKMVAQIGAHKFYE